MLTKVTDTLESTLKKVLPEETEFIKCSNCDKKLLRLISDKKGEEILFNVIVDCPFCSDHSFSTPIYGTLRYLPADGIQLTNCLNEKNNVVHFLTKKV